VTLESNGKTREFKPTAKGKWDVLVASTMQVSVGDQIRVTGGFREGKNVFKNNDVARGGKSQIRSLFYMTAGGCGETVRASIKASASPHMQANAVRSIRWLRCPTVPTQKAGT
jgi:hypothetical protein